MLVSVLMTSYNREAYIAEAIEAVLRSSFRDFELIICDDRSTDRTVEIAKHYEKTDNRVRVFVNRRNLGQFANRNKAASYARGKFLKYVDSDDIIYPYTLQIMMDAMNKYPEAGLAFSIKYIDSERPYPYLLSSGEALYTHYLENELLMVGPTGTIMKKSAFDEVNGFEEFGMPSDNHLTLKIAAKYPVVALQRDLFWWRRHEGQVFTSNQNNHQNILNNYLFNTDILRKHSPLTKKQNQAIRWNQKKIFFMNLVKLSIRNAKPVAALSLLTRFLKTRQAG